MSIEPDGHQDAFLTATSRNGLAPYMLQPRGLGDVSNVSTAGF